ncbi:DHH family phosphoesterase [Candidatus Saccharibacteria bacterium]|nr:DHH family phosphoesterase [Candidatus Saccharibacteria bacterium]
MADYPEIKDIISSSQRILVIQADNPDADSLASSLALEQIFHDMGKEPILYCGIDMPEYLKYLFGWDRVEKDVPSQFDASIIVDTSTMTLLEKLTSSGSQGWVAAKPVIVLDHHAEVQNDIPFATVVVNEPTKVSTGELLYAIAKQHEWPINLQAASYIMTSILADSMGLATENTSAATYRVMAELVDSGVNRPQLEEQRRSFNKMPPSIFKYKAELIERTELHDQLAIVTVPQAEINEYSPLYNPAPLIQNDHLLTAGVLVSIVIKQYDSGRVTGAIRCNQGAPIAAKLAEELNGGGHAYAAGFKVDKGDASEIKQKCIERVKTLLESK